jgi:hypothetical protein
LGTFPSIADVIRRWQDSLAAELIAKQSFWDGSEIEPSFNPEPEATAVSTRDCRPETAGACGFGLNEEAGGNRDQ